MTYYFTYDVPGGSLTFALDNLGDGDGTAQQMATGPAIYERPCG